MGLKSLWVVSMKQQGCYAINENLFFVAIAFEASSRSDNPSCQKQEILLQIINMPPLSKAASANANPEAATASNPWIPVTWFPHTSLSQTCYVKLNVRAAFDRSEQLLPPSIGEWRVRATVHGMAGTPLGLPTETSAATMRPVSEWQRGRPPPAYDNNSNKKQEDQQQQFPPLLVDGGCTHGCVWEETIRLPIRWRDLPRDAYLHLEILGPTDEMVRRRD